MGHIRRIFRSLDGIWSASSDLAQANSFFRNGFDDSLWHQVVVPGHWQEYNGFEDYPDAVLFRKSFDFIRPSGDNRYLLRFEGLFYNCDVWCNGEYLGAHEGYFSPFEFDVTGLLRVSNNIIAVRVICPVEFDLDNKRKILGIFGHWDCKPDNIHPGGIWNSVSIVEKPPLSIDYLSVSSFRLSPEAADALITVEVFHPGAGKRDCEISWFILPANFVGGPVKGHATVTLPAGKSSSRHKIPVTIPDPSLWWPWDHGKPTLYRIDLTIECGEDNFATAAERFGIRTVEFDDYIMRINGRRIFLRGSNYAPADIRLASASTDTYDNDTMLIRRANLNMVRVHAHVEKQAFYDRCDELGILVYQDFPLQWTYTPEVEETALAQITEMALLLDSHPSIVLWCCHNEPFIAQEAITLRDAVREFRLPRYIEERTSFMKPNWNKTVLDKKLKARLAKTDPSRPIIKHSGVLGIGPTGTDSHFYMGWYFGSMRQLALLYRLNKKAFRFLTEYGAQAFPTLKSFLKIQNVLTLNQVIWSDLSRHHMLQKKVMDTYVPPRKGSTLADYITATQEYQATLIKYHNEFLRSIRYNPCGGAIHFMLNDSYPGITWSVLDYWREPKMGYDALRDSFRPLHVMAEYPRDEYDLDDDIEIPLLVVNDQYTEYGEATVKWTFYGTRKRKLAEGSREISIGEDSLEKAGAATLAAGVGERGPCSLVLVLSGPDIKSSIINQYTFTII